MKEQTISKFKYGKDTYKLLEITENVLGTDGWIKDYMEVHYLITKNRRRITQSRWKVIAQKKFANIITGELLKPI